MTGKPHSNVESAYTSVPSTLPRRILEPYRRKNLVKIGLKGGKRLGNKVDRMYIDIDAHAAKAARPTPHPLEKGGVPSSPPPPETYAGLAGERKQDSLLQAYAPVSSDETTPASNAYYNSLLQAAKAKSPEQLIEDAKLLSGVEPLSQNSSKPQSLEDLLGDEVPPIGHQTETERRAEEAQREVAAKYAPKVSDELLMLQQIRRWRVDIMGFAKNALFIVPTWQQEKVLLAMQKPGAKVSVRAGHGVGKTTAEAILAIWHVLLFTNSKTACTAPSASQLRDVLMAEIGRILQSCHPWVKAQLSFSNMRLEVVGKEASQFLTARTARPEQPDALQGLHAENMLFIVDEAFGVADSIFEVARGALSTPGARVLLCGNPTATSGYCYNTHNRNKEMWVTFQLNAEESPLVSKASILEWETEYGKDSDEYRVRVLGDFPRASICQLIPRSLAEEATLRKLFKGHYCFQPIVLGVDVAWEGDDRSVIFARQGLFAWKVWEGRNVDSITLGNLIRQYWDELQADGVFIDVGWGSGVIDYLRSLGRNPIAVNFGSSATSNEYANKRTEMWCEIRKWLDLGGVIPREESLLDDLTGPNYSFLGSGKKMLEPKKMMKKRGLKSPDLGDALALTFAAPVVKRREIEVFQPETAVCVTDFDIYS